jgi:hypothetical protein
VLITVHPEAVMPDALTTVDAVFALGPHAADVMTTFCKAIGETPPEGLTAPEDERVLFWDRRNGRAATLITVEKPQQAHQRHTRKYAEGELPEDRSFYFRGPRNALNLRAQNLTMFLQLAEGVDEATWTHHLRAGDYSDWFRRAIKDDDLADEAAAIEAEEGLGAAESHKRLAEAIRRRYTAPATAS